MNQKPNAVQIIVVVAIALLTLIGLFSLCGTMYYRNYSDPSVLVAVISITSGLAGSLTTLLIGRTVSKIDTEVTNPPERPIPTAPVENP